MADRPGTAFEKLMSFRGAHYELGKEYDEAALRRQLGLPPVVNPEFLAETPERRRLVRMDDREARREADQAQAEARDRLAAQSASVQEAAYKDARISALEAQLAEMQAALSGPKVTVTVPEGATEGSQGTVKALPEGAPNETWGKADIIRWLEDQGLPLPERKGFQMSKLAVLEFALEQINERESVPYEQIKKAEGAA